jgi:PhoPQ-activated pathogenicity-related protein
MAALAVCVYLVGAVRADQTALDRYVAKPDATYSWKIDRKMEAHGAGTYIVDLKSQTWRTPQEVNRPVWQHWLTIIRPAHPVSHTAFLFITGGSNGGKAPKSADLLMASLARETNTVVAELKMVPNEPLIFHNDGVKRTEDDLIAYTWDQFLKGGDDEWPARLPMVKSAVRAMDCVQELVASKEGGDFKIDKFVVAGGSKRGWTTWCTAAVDKRVEAIIPLSIDCLNSNESMRHHVAVYGFYTEAVGDYFNHKITARANHPRMKLLNAIEDPYSYRDRFTMPKFIVGGAGDQYFCPDNSQFYFDQLPGEKYLRYIPNTDHGLGGSDVRSSPGSSSRTGRFACTAAPSRSRSSSGRRPIPRPATSASRRSAAPSRAANSATKGAGSTWPNSRSPSAAGPPRSWNCPSTWARPIR